jgi:hypothetical protein
MPQETSDDWRIRLVPSDHVDAFHTDLPPLKFHIAANDQRKHPDQWSAFVMANHWQTIGKTTNPTLPLQTKLAVTVTCLTTTLRGLNVALQDRRWADRSRINPPMFEEEVDNKVFAGIGHGRHSDPAEDEKIPR